MYLAKQILDNYEIEDTKTIIIIHIVIGTLLIITSGPNGTFFNDIVKFVTNAYETVDFGNFFYTQSQTCI